MIFVPIAPGELIDKITILSLKLERITDAAKLSNVSQELDALRAVQVQHIPRSPEIADLENQLKAINGVIWDLEDSIRECERNKDFGDLFLATARNIYRSNDQRAAIKKQINLHLQSALVEEKSYAPY